MRIRTVARHRSPQGRRGRRVACLVDPRWPTLPRGRTRGGELQPHRRAPGARPVSAWDDVAPTLRFIGPRVGPRVESEHAGDVLRQLGRTPRLDVVSAWRLLAFAEYDVRRSFFEDVWQVPVGCRIGAAKDGHLHIDSPDAPPVADGTPESAVAECRRLIESAIKCAVEPAARAGVLLSGGLDSG